MVGGGKARNDIKCSNHNTAPYLDQFMIRSWPYFTVSRYPGSIFNMDFFKVFVKFCYNISSATCFGILAVRNVGSLLPDQRSNLHPQC